MDARTNRCVLLRPVLCAWLLCGVMCLSAAASERDSVADEERAFSLYQSAAEDFKIRAFAAGVGKLEDAYALFPKAIILIKLAEGLEHLGRIEEAQARFAEVLPEDPEMDQRVQASLRRLSVQLARPVSVSILTGEVRGVRVVLDGVDTGLEAPTVMEVARGRHVLQLFKTGYEVYLVDPFEVAGVAPVIVDVSLTEKLYTVSVALDGQGVDEVSATLDGQPIALRARQGDVMATFVTSQGVHDFACDSPRGTSSASFRVNGSQQTVLSCVAASSDDGHALGWTLVGTGSALFVGGAVLLTWHFIDEATADSKNRNLAPGEPAVKPEPAIPHRDILGPVLMGVGVTTGLLSLLVLLDEDDAEAASHITPMWVPTTAGGGVWGLSGRF